MTMHRPSNVDQVTKLNVIIEAIKGIAAIKKVVLPLHPRTLKSLKNFNKLNDLLAVPNVDVIDPQGYLEFLHLMDNSRLIVTDSGGIQEESTFLKIPCLTIRNSTERPVTVDLGTNILIPELNADQIVDQFKKSLKKENRETIIPPLWDGKTAVRIADILSDKLRVVVDVE